MFAQEQTPHLPSLFYIGRRIPFEPRKMLSAPAGFCTDKNKEIGIEIEYRRPTQTCLKLFILGEGKLKILFGRLVSALLV
jgi:hypothetical protein